MNVKDLKSLKNILPRRTLMHACRHAFCALMALIALAGVMQIGLQWEGKQPIARSTVVLSDYRVVTGVLSQNWSGDFVITDHQGGVTTFTPSRIMTLSVSQDDSQGDPWRLILSLFLAVGAAAASAFTALAATQPWVALAKVQAPRPVAPRSPVQAGQVRPAVGPSRPN